MNTPVTERTPVLQTKLPAVGTTIFTVMSGLAAEKGAVNLGQGFPDFDCDPRLVNAVTDAMVKGLNQYPPMTGVPVLREAIAQKVQAMYGRQYDAATEITVTAGAKTSDGTFVLREVKGAKEDPSELVCELVETGETFTVTKERPFTKAYGFSVDLFYQFAKQDFNGKRVDDQLSLSGSNYKIVAITKDEVVVSDPDTKKRSVIPTPSTR